MIQDHILFIDLDGTIIDASRRLYQIHQDTLKELGIDTPHSQEGYIALKRKRKPEPEIIPFVVDSEKREWYIQQRHKRIEEWEYLLKDRVFPWSKEALKQLRKQNTVILCTRRKNPLLVLRQLQYLGINELFHDIIISSAGKAEKIKAHPLFVPEKAVIVGDTEADIEAGKLLGVRTIAVLSGCRDKEFLENYHPDLIVENIKSLVGQEILI